MFQSVQTYIERNKSSGSMKRHTLTIFSKVKSVRNNSKEYGVWTDIEKFMTNHQLKEFLNNGVDSVTKHLGVSINHRIIWRVMNRGWNANCVKTSDSYRDICAFILLWIPKLLCGKHFKSLHEIQLHIQGSHQLGSTDLVVSQFGEEEVIKKVVKSKAHIFRNNLIQQAH